MQQINNSSEHVPSLLVVLATLGKRSHYLEQTLDSIKSQDFKNLSITLIYPLSNRETLNLAKKYGAKSLSDPGSMSKAVNVGIVDGWDKFDYITWIGDDDLLLSKSLSTSIRWLESNKNTSATYGYCKYIDQDGKYLFTSKAGALAKFILPWGPNLVPLPGTVFRSSALKKLDYLFDESLKYSMDLDLFLRLMKVGQLKSLNFPVSAFRWHTTSTTVSNRKASITESEQVKRKYLPVVLRPIAPLWEIPVRIATFIAASRVNRLHSK